MRPTLMAQTNVTVRSTACEAVCIAFSPLCSCPLNPAAPNCHLPRIGLLSATCLYIQCTAIERARRPCRTCCHAVAGRKDVLSRAALPLLPARKLSLRRRVSLFTYVNNRCIGSGAQAGFLCVPGMQCTMASIVKIAGTLWQYTRTTGHSFRSG